MTASSAICHVASALCPVPAERAFGHLTGAAGMAQWCLGMMDCAEEKPALMRGRSLFDGAEAWVRVDSDPAKFSAEYWCGAAPDALTPRIHARVIPGPSLGYGAHECLATLLAWRPAAMSDERWRRLMVTHETEILLIREQLTREIATIDPTKQE